MAKYLNDTGLSYFYDKLKTVFQAKESGKGLSTNDYTTTEKNKLSGIATGAEVNQNAFSTVKVGTTNVSADSKTDTLTLEASTNITITPDATNDKITISATDTTYSDATTSASGLMSATDKTKLDGIASGAQVNVIETVKVNNTALTPSSKAVNITVPTVTDTYSGTSSNAMSGKAVKSAIDALDGVITGTAGSGKTLTAFSQTDGKVSATFGSISITKSQVSDFPSIPSKTSDLDNDSGFITINDVPEGSTASSTTPKMDGTATVGTETAFARGDHIHPTDTSRASSTHTHGNVTNDGKITATGVTIGNKDALVITDYSASGALVKTSIEFDGSTQSLFLTKKGSWAGVYASDVGLSQDWQEDDVEEALTNVKALISNHTSNTSNPHSVTKAQVGLGNVTNESKATMFTSPAFTGTPTAPTASAGTNTTQVATTAFVKSAIDTAIAGVTQFDIQVVTSLPTTGTSGVIYLVAHSHGTGDAYDEYIWTGSAYEKIGNTDVDLSGYWAKADLVAITTSEIDALFTTA